MSHTADSLDVFREKDGKSHENVTFRPRCHPWAGTLTTYFFDEQVIVVRCADCDEPVIDFRIALDPALQAANDAG